MKYIIYDDNDNQQNDQMPDVAAKDNVTSTSSLPTHWLEDCLSMIREQLIKEQQDDADLCRLMEEAVNEEEATRYANCIGGSRIFGDWFPNFLLQAHS